MNSKFRDEFEKILIRRMSTVLKPRGYSRRELAWYRMNGPVTTAIFVCPSQTKLVVRLARFDRRINRETHPVLDVAVERVGMSALVPNRDEWNKVRTYLDWTTESDVGRFVEFIERYGLPRMAAMESRRVE